MEDRLRVLHNQTHLDGLREFDGCWARAATRADAQFTKQIVLSRMIMSCALSMMARAIPGLPDPRLGRSPSRTPSPLTPLTLPAPSAPCGACEEDKEDNKMPPWLSDHAISRPRRWDTDVVPTALEHRRGSRQAPAADRPLAGRYDQESGGLLRLLYGGIIRFATQLIPPGRRARPRMPLTSSQRVNL